MARFEIGFPSGKIRKRKAPWLTLLGARAEILHRTADPGKVFGPEARECI
jgi:hypothetical protein